MVSQPAHVRQTPWFKSERVIGFALPMLFAVVFGLWSQSRYASYWMLDAMGEETMATIIEKSIVRSNSARPGMPKYVMQVGFAAGGEMRRGQVPVTRAFYDRHEPGQRVRIRFLSHDPQLREVDPGVRGEMVRTSLVIIAILVFVGMYNLIALKAPAKPASRNGERI